MKKSVIAVLVVALVLILGVVASALFFEEKHDFVFSNDPYLEEGSFIDKDSAIEIALDKAGISKNDADFIKVELDREGRAVLYEVEIIDGRYEYSADVRADDGRIVDWDVDFDD